VRDVALEICGKARELLSEGKVRRVIGWERSPRTGLPIPCVITRPEDAGRLTFGPLCAHPPTTYLSRDGAVHPTAIVARACDTRAIVVQLQENDLRREDVFVIAVGCDGVADTAKIEERLGRPWSTVTEVTSGNGSVTVTTDVGEAELRVPDDLLDRCTACPVPQPVIEDMRIGEFPEAPPRRDDPLAAEVAELEAMSRDERRAFFGAAFARCIRCYACRNVCPICSCERCTADETQPQWIPRSTLGSENELFLTLRAMHMAGRCTFCGACARACTMDVPLMVLNTKLAQEVERMFGHIAGTDPDAQPPMWQFEKTDPELPGHGGEAR